jgi:hypothetical protein
MIPPTMQSSIKTTVTGYKIKMETTHEKIEVQEEMEKFTCYLRYLLEVEIIKNNNILVKELHDIIKRLEDSETLAKAVYNATKSVHQRIQKLDFTNSIPEKFGKSNPIPQFMQYKSIEFVEEQKQKFINYLSKLLTEYCTVDNNCKGCDQSKKIGQTDWKNLWFYESCEPDSGICKIQGKECRAKNDIKSQNLKKIVQNMIRRLVEYEKFQAINDVINLMFGKDVALKELGHKHFNKYNNFVFDDDEIIQNLLKDLNQKKNLDDNITEKIHALEKIHKEKNNEEKNGWPAENKQYQDENTEEKKSEEKKKWFDFRRKKHITKSKKK